MPARAAKRHRRAMSTAAAVIAMKMALDGVLGDEIAIRLEGSFRCRASELLERRRRDAPRPSRR